MFRATILPIFRSIRLCNTAYGMLYPIRCRWVIWWSPPPNNPPATYWVQHTTSCILLLQPALQPLWVLACSTIAEHSQQEGFYRVPLPAARQTPNLEGQWLERSNCRHQVSPTSEMTRANPSSGRWNYGREMSENFAESGDFHLNFWFFYMP